MSGWHHKAIRTRAVIMAFNLLFPVSYTHLIGSMSNIVTGLNCRLKTVGKGTTVGSKICVCGLFLFRMQLVSTHHAPLIMFIGISQKICLLQHIN